MKIISIFHYPFLFFIFCILGLIFYTQKSISQSKFYQLRPLAVVDENICLAISKSIESSEYISGVATLKKCSNSPEQLWDLQPNSEDPPRYNLKSKLTGENKCLELLTFMGDITESAAMMVNSCSTNPEQLWDFVPVKGLEGVEGLLFDIQLNYSGSIYCLTAYPSLSNEKVQMKKCSVDELGQVWGVLEIK